jgi:hypothetical protein
MIKVTHNLKKISINLIKSKGILIISGIGVCMIACTVGFFMGKSKLYKNIPSGYEPTPIKEICVKEREIDVGEVSPDQVVKSSFELLNICNKPITIKEVKASCGCTTTDLSKRVVLPDKNLIVPLTIDISKISDISFQKAIWVGFEEIHGDPNQNIVFQIKGLIDRDGKVLAWPNVLDFGNVIPGQDYKIKVYLRASNQLLSNLPETILIDELKDKILSVKISPEKTKTEVKAVNVALQIPDSAAFNSLNTSLAIKFQTSPPRQVTFQIKANITPGFIVEPKKIYFSTSNTEKTSPVDVKIESINAELPVGISEISSELPIEWKLINSNMKGKQILRVQPSNNLNLSSVKTGQLLIRFSNNFRQEISVVLVPINSSSDKNNDNKKQLDAF